MSTNRHAHSDPGLTTLWLLAEAGKAAFRAAVLFASLAIHLLGLAWSMLRPIRDLGQAAYAAISERIRLARITRNLHLAAAGLFLESEDLYVECPHWRVTCEASS